MTSISSFNFSIISSFSLSAGINLSDSTFIIVALSSCEINLDGSTFTLSAGISLDGSDFTSITLSAGISLDGSDFTLSAGINLEGSIFGAVKNCSLIVKGS